MTAKVATWQLVVRALCAFALVFAVFAHHPSLPGYASDIDLAQYALPDGSLPDICPANPDWPPAKQGPDRHCAFCRIVASIALPDAPTYFVPCALASDLDYVLPDDDESIRYDHSANASPRGPPASNLQIG